MKYTTLAGVASMAFVLPNTAFAHHPLGGMPMETFAHGLLSGFGHPVLGFDHLFFVAAVGIAALYTGYRFAAPAAYIAAMLLGCLAMSIGIELPAKEIVIGLSLLVLGGIVLAGKTPSLFAVLGVFAGFGLFHGSAFGEALASEEAAVGGQVLIGYVIGLGVTQYALALGAGWLVFNGLKATSADKVQARLSGAVVAGMGLLLTLENVEGIVLDLVGWGA